MSHLLLESNERSTLLQAMYMPLKNEKPVNPYWRKPPMPSHREIEIIDFPSIAIPEKGGETKIKLPKSGIIKKVVLKITPKRTES